MVWLPRTAVGSGNERGADGVAEGVELFDGVADVVGDPDCAAEGDGDVATVDGEAGVVADDGAVDDGVVAWVGVAAETDVACVAVGEAPAELATGLELA